LSDCISCGILNDEPGKCIRDGCISCCYCARVIIACTRCGKEPRYKNKETGKVYKLCASCALEAIERSDKNLESLLYLFRTLKTADPTNLQPWYKTLKQIHLITGSMCEEIENENSN
jgi:hypothetical protein